MWYLDETEAKEVNNFLLPNSNLLYLLILKNRNVALGMIVVFLLSNLVIFKEGVEFYADLSNSYTTPS